MGNPISEAPSVELGRRKVSSLPHAFFFHMKCPGESIRWQPERDKNVLQRKFGITLFNELNS